MQQIDNLLWLTEQLKEHHIHVMLYTGYELDEIEADPLKKRMCQMADVLIPGRYREELRDTNLKWRGSRNQPLIFADREEPGRDENQVEIIIEPDGTVTCLGYPSEGLVQYLRSLDLPIRTAN